jgi:DNA-directed RNA polymerase sigma subunit (sigma70/sigma32)
MKLLILKNVRSVDTAIDVGDKIAMSKKNLLSDVFQKHLKNIKNVNRKEENALVDQFQKTGDISIIEKVYVKRIPTLANWSLRYYYPGLELSIDDFMEELSIVFMKAANKYNIEKGSFNTCLYTYLNNRIKNMKNSTHAKKRRPENYDGPISGVLLSLDHPYSSDGDSEKTLKDFLEAKEGDDHTKYFKETGFHDTVNLLSNGNSLLRDVFVRLGEGSTLASIIKDYKTKKGSVRVSDIKNLDNKTLKTILIEKSKVLDENFVVVDYSFSGDKISYVLEYDDTEETRVIKRSIKSLRKNKDDYINRIRI